LTLGVGKGNFKVDEVNQTVQISLNDALNRSMIDFFNEILVDESAIRVTSAELDWSLTSKVLNKQILSNGYELTFADPNIVPLMKRATSGWNINILESSEVPPNSVLMWDNYIQKWVAGPQMLDLFLTDARYLRLDTGGTVRGDIVCNTSVIAGEILSSKTLEVQENIAAATGTLGTLVNPFKGTDNNDIVTVGKLFDELANYTPGGTTGDYLPLTGGTLSGPLNLQRNLFFDSSVGNANIHVLGGSATDLTFFTGADAEDVDPTFSIGRFGHNVFNIRIGNLGDAIYDGDALNRRSGAKLFLERSGGEMTGDITFKDCGFKQPNGTASLSAQGSLSATRLFTKRNSNWDQTEVLNYASLSGEFLRRTNPKYSGQITAEQFNTQFHAPGGISFFDQGTRAARLGADLKFYRRASFENNRITNVSEPVNDSDVATKKYVDENGGGGGGGFTAHLGNSSNLERGSIVLNNSNVLSVVV
jgi:hypothetical protein